MSQPLSIDDVNQLYPWEWILLRVADIDREGVISHGEVLDHSRHRRKLNRTMARIHEHDPQAHIYIFLGGTRNASGEEFRRALAEATEHLA